MKKSQRMFLMAAMPLSAGILTPWSSGWHLLPVVSDMRAPSTSTIPWQ